MSAFAQCAHCLKVLVPSLRPVFQCSHCEGWTSAPDERAITEQEATLIEEGYRVLWQRQCLAQIGRPFTLH